MTADLVIEPACSAIVDRCRTHEAGRLDGHTLTVWREKTRAELGLAIERPIIATGHQSLLWHPGILAKYLLVDALAHKHDLATANLVVDQHAGDYGSFDIPIRRGDGALSVRRLQLAAVRKDEPMGLHEPFTPPPPPTHLPVAEPYIQAGIDRIYAACNAHRNAANAALQMGQALSDLMQPWVAPMVHVTATDLVETSLARAMMAHMVADPWRCAETYNRALIETPEAGIRSLLVRDDYVELPLWRVRADRRRMHAYDGDVEHHLAGASMTGEPIMVLPRALFMTALIRLGMCDLFVHGTGGAAYDRAMERWIVQWLNLTPAPVAVATATLTLDLAAGAPDRARDLATDLAAARRAWHDPAAGDGERPSDEKRMLLRQITELPSGSAARRRFFFDMHERLGALRGEHRQRIEAAERRAERTRRLVAEAPIVDRRTWAFPLYPDEAIDGLAHAVRARVDPCPVRR